MSIPIASTLGRIRSTALRLVISKQRWTVIDQVIISLTNFVTMVLLARGLSLDGFGWFSLAHMTLMLSNSFQNNLVSLPHNVLGATRHGEEYIRYTTSTVLSQLMLGAAQAGLVLLGWSVAVYYGWSMAPFVLAMAPLIFFWQLNECARRMLFTEQRVTAAVVNDFLSNGTYVTMIGVLWWNSALSPTLALFVLAITTAGGSLLGWWQLRRSLAPRLDFSAFPENWNFGKWLVSSDIVGNWLSSKLFVYLTAGMVGVAATGMLKTLEVVFGPTRLLVMAINNILPSRFARTLHQRGLAELDSEFRRTFSLAIPLLAAYSLLVVLFAHPIMSLFGDKYEGHFLLVALYAVSALMSYVSSFLGTALRARRMTWQVFVDCSIGSLIVVPFGCAAIHWLGEYGTVLGMIATYVSMSTLNWMSYRRDHRQELAEAAQAASQPKASQASGTAATGTPARTSQDRVADELRRELFGASAVDDWSFRRLSPTKDVFLASGHDGKTIWQAHSQVVVKLFNPPSPEMIKAARDQLELMKILNRRMNGQLIAGWKVCAPVPLLAREEPMVLVMSAVSGRQLGAVLESPALDSVQVRQSIAEALAQTLRRFWAEDLQVYGDLHFENILCDVEQRTLSFVDPGPPIESWYGAEAMRFTQPASRDLAYLMYTVAMTHPGYCSALRFRREMELAEEVLRAYLRGLTDAEETHQFLDEFRRCFGFHAEGGGAAKNACRKVRRWLLLPTIDRILRRVKADCCRSAVALPSLGSAPSASTWQSEAV